MQIKTINLVDKHQPLETHNKLLRLSPNLKTSQSQSSASPHDYVATPETAGDPCWYIDSGGTDHVTADPSNLATRTKYSELEQLHIGNESSMSIAHTESNIFSSQSKPSRQFHSSFCFVKDQHTKKCSSREPLKMACICLISH